VGALGEYQNAKFSTILMYVICVWFLNWTSDVTSNTCSSLRMLEKRLVETAFGGHKEDRRERWRKV